MGLSCFSRPKTLDGASDQATYAAAARTTIAPLARQRSHHSISPMASGLSSAAAAAASAAASVSVEPVAQLSQRLYRMLTPQSSPDKGDDTLQQEAESSCGSFLSARSDPLSDVGSCTSGVACLLCLLHCSRSCHCGLLAHFSSNSSTPQNCTHGDFAA